MYSVANYVKMYKLVTTVHIEVELTATHPRSLFQGPVPHSRPSLPPKAATVLTFSVLSPCLYF